MGLGPNIIIRAHEADVYLDVPATTIAGIMGAARLFINRMRPMRDIVSVDSITFTIRNGNSWMYIDVQAMLRGPYGRNTFSAAAHNKEPALGTAWDVELAGELMQCAVSAIRLELQTTASSQAMLDKFLKSQLLPA